MNSNHKTSIRLMPGGFCVSTGEFINISPGADYEQRLEDAILDLEINTGEEDLECIVETARMSLSPTACDESLAEDMYGLTLRRQDTTEKILHEASKDGEIRISFGIDNTLYNFLIRTFQFIIFHHPIIEILNSEALKIHPTDNWMVAKVSQGSISIAAYKNKQLQVANCIETMITQNRAYHLLNIWAKLELDVLSDTLYIFGEEQEVSKLKKSVSKFIKKCE